MIKNSTQNAQWNKNESNHIQEGWLGSLSRDEWVFKLTVLFLYELWFYEIIDDP